jgi:hypothetical protein
MTSVAQQLGRVMIAGGAIAAAVFMLAQTRTDVDLWGHVRFGLDILSTGALHQQDPYSFTSDRLWINHEWLSEVVFALAWRHGAAPGLIAVKLACGAGALALIAATARQNRVGAEGLVFLTTLTLLGILPRVSQVRPQLFSVILFAALIRVFVSAQARGLRALLWTIPIIVFWANFHGGWLVGVGAVATWCAGEAYASPTRRDAFVALGIGVLCVVATLMNPYGWGLWHFLLETVQFGRDAIREWGAAWTNPATALIWIVFALLLGGSLVGLKRVPPNPAAVLIPLGLGLASLKVSRLDAFFAMSVMGLLAGPVASLFRQQNSVPLEASRYRLLATFGVAVLLLVSIPASRRAFTCIGFFDARWPEAEMVEQMRVRQLSGRLLTYFDWGEYAIWHLYPALKVSMDGRRETVYSDRTVDLHLALYNGAPDGLAYVGELNPDYIWLPRYLPVVDTLKHDGWLTVIEGSMSTVLGRPNATSSGSMAAVPSIPGRRCFPGP